MTKHITAQLGDSMCLTSLRGPHRGRTLVRLRVHVRKAPTKHQHVRTMFARSPSYPFPAWIAWRSGSSPGPVFRNRLKVWAGENPKFTTVS